MSETIDAALQRLESEVQVLKRELQNSEDRYETWKNHVAEDCRSAESSHQARLETLQRKIITLADAIQGQESSRKRDVKTLQDLQTQWVRDQVEMVRSAESSMRGQIERFKEETREVIKDNQTKMWSENAQMAEAFVMRSDQLKTQINAANNRTQDFFQTRQAASKAELEKRIADTVKMSEESTLSQCTRDLSTLKEELVSRLEEDLGRQGKVTHYLEERVFKAISGGRHEMEEEFQKRIDMRVSQIEESYLKGMDQLESYLDSQNEQRAQDIAQLAGACDGTSREVKQVSKALTTKIARMEAALQAKFEDLDNQNNNKLDEIERLVQENFVDMQKDNDKKLRTLYDENLKLKEALDVKSEMVRKFHNEAVESRQVCSKELAMLQMRFGTLERECKDTDRVATECREEYNATKEQLEQAFLQQKETFVEYENKVLQHARDFRDFLDSQPDERAELDDVIQSWTGEIDNLSTKLESCLDEIGRTKDSLQKNKEEQESHNATLRKMGKTWESLYAHMATQIQDQDAKSTSILGKTDKIRGDLEQKLSEQATALKQDIERVHAVINDESEKIVELKKESDQHSFGAAELLDKLEDLRKKEIGEVSQQLASQMVALRNTKEKIEKTQEGMDAMAKALDERFKTLDGNIAAKASTTDVADIIDKEHDEFDSKIVQISSSVAEQTAKVLGMEEHLSSTVSSLKVLEEDFIASIDRLSQVEIGHDEVRIEFSENQLKLREHVTKRVADIADDVDKSRKKIDSVTAKLEEKMKDRSVHEFVERTVVELASKIDCNRAEIDSEVAEIRAETSKHVLKTDDLEKKLDLSNLAFTALDDKVDDASDQTTALSTKLEEVCTDLLMLQQDMGAAKICIEKNEESCSTTKESIKEVRELSDKQRCALEYIETEVERSFNEATSLRASIGSWDKEKFVDLSENQSQSVQDIVNLQDVMLSNQQETETMFESMKEQVVKVEDSLEQKASKASTEKAIEIHGNIVKSRYEAVLSQLEEQVVRIKKIQEDLDKQGAEYQALSDCVGSWTDENSSTISEALRRQIVAHQSLRAEVSKSKNKIETVSTALQSHADDVFDRLKTMTTLTDVESAIKTHVHETKTAISKQILEVEAKSSNVMCEATCGLDQLRVDLEVVQKRLSNTNDKQSFEVLEQQVAEYSSQLSHMKKDYSQNVVIQLQKLSTEVGAKADRTVMYEKLGAMKRQMQDMAAVAPAQAERSEPVTTELKIDSTVQGLDSKMVRFTETMAATSPKNIAEPKKLRKSSRRDQLKKLLDFSIEVKKDLGFEMEDRDVAEDAAAPTSARE